MVSTIDKEILAELNQCRSNPRKYSANLTNIIKYYNGKTYEKPGSQVKETREGVENVESCIKYLKTIRPSPLLKWSPSLAQAAKYHADDLGPLGGSGHISSDGSDMYARTSKFCNWTGHLGENIDYGTNIAKDIVLSLLIDDGMLARGQRLNIMKKDHKYVGAAVGFHSLYEFMCVIVFAEQVQEDLETCPNSDLTLDLEEIKDVRIDGESRNDFFIRASSGENYDSTQEYLEYSELLSKEFEKIKVETELIESTHLKNQPESVRETQDLELSDDSAFSKTAESVYNIDKSDTAINNEECTDLNFSISKTEISIKNHEPEVVVAKKIPKSRPPIDYKLKQKKEEFNVSNFERSELSKEAIFEIKELFDIYDVSGSGIFDQNSLKSMKLSQGSECSNSEAIQVLCNIDPDEIGALNFDNFIDLVVEKLGLSQSNKLKSFSISKKSSNSSVLIKSKKAFDPTLFLRPELTKQDIIEIKEAFDMFDVDNTGTINPFDLNHTMQLQGFETKNPTIFRMINNIKVDHAEKVNFGEFLDLLISEGTDHTSAEELKKFFNLFDVEKNGYIELKNLKNIAMELGESLDEEDIVQLITKSDLDGDGRVSFEDFYYIMNKKLF